MLFVVILDPFKGSPGGVPCGHDYCQTVGQTVNDFIEQANDTGIVAFTMVVLHINVTRQLRVSRNYRINEFKAGE